jgi:uncharacterized DUF497 family protein
MVPENVNSGRSADFKTPRKQIMEPTARVMSPLPRVIGVAQGHVLFVVVTQRGEDTCRIISVRKATRHEENRYYAGDRETW